LAVPPGGILQDALEADVSHVALKANLEASLAHNHRFRPSQEFSRFDKG
jgi:hypothetical protein